MIRIYNETNITKKQKKIKRLKSENTKHLNIPFLNEMNIR